jgi:hypothetical protein
MGQYHLIANLDTREYLNPHELGNGVKLMEFASGSYGVMFGVGLLLAGKWDGTRLAILGDYGERGDLPDNILGDDIVIDYNEGDTPYSCIENGGQFNEVSTFTRHLMYRTGLVKKRPDARVFDYFEVLDKKIETSYDAAIFNHTKQEYITGDYFGDSNDMYHFIIGGYGSVMSALALLLASSCHGGARGGGDYNSGIVDNDFVGSWAGDVIGFVPLEEVSAQATNISEKIRDNIAMVENGYVSYTIDIHTGFASRQTLF